MELIKSAINIQKYGARRDSNYGSHWTKSSAPTSSATLALALFSAIFLVPALILISEIDRRKKGVKFATR